VKARLAVANLLEVGVGGRPGARRRVSVHAPRSVGQVGPEGQADRGREVSPQACIVPHAARRRCAPTA
jgi:hypothetical protein